MTDPADPSEPADAAGGAGAAGPAAGIVADRLALADWRRRIADLYGEVRAIAHLDPVAAWSRWRAVRDDLYRGHPQSPVPPAGRTAHIGRYWPYDPALRFEVAVRPAGPPAANSSAGSLGPSPIMPTSSGEAMAYISIGPVALALPGGARSLDVFWMSGYAGGLFLPFRDATNGRSTYGAGRYLLDTAKGADLGGGVAEGYLILDFNFAFQPSCAFDPRWACPLAPRENWLDLPVEAGERLTLA